MLEDIKNYWQGKKPLWEALWLLWIIPSFIIGCFLVILWKNAYLIKGPGVFDISNFYHPIELILIPYTLFCAIPVWRCSKNSNIVFEIATKLYISFICLHSIVYIYLFFIKPNFLHFYG